MSSLVPESGPAEGSSSKGKTSGGSCSSYIVNKVNVLTEPAELLRSISRFRSTFPWQRQVRTGHFFLLPMPFELQLGLAQLREKSSPTRKANGTAQLRRVANPLNNLPHAGATPQTTLRKKCETVPAAASMNMPVPSPI